MSDKFIFQNARIKALEVKLLNSQHLTRLLDSENIRDAFKMLVELGIGSDAEPGDMNFDALFLAEEKSAYKLLGELNTDKALDTLLLQSDFHNLKVAIKAFYAGTKSAVYMPNGLYDVETMKSCVETKNYILLSDDMKVCLQEIEKLNFENRLEPQLIDTIVDKAMFKRMVDVAPKGGKLMVKYVQNKVDFINLLTFMRCKNLSLNEKFFETAFIPYGSLKINELLKIYDQSIENLRDVVKFTIFKDAVTNSIESGSLVGFEVGMDNALFKMWNDERSDMFSVAPIVAYFLQKLVQLKDVKLIVSGIKNGVAPELIKQRMRDIYA